MFILHVLFIKKQLYSYPPLSEDRFEGETHIPTYAYLLHTYIVYHLKNA